MWVKHVPGQCVPQTSSTRSTAGGRGSGGQSGAGRGSVHTATAAPANAKGRADVSKTKAIKEFKATFANNELDAKDLAKKAADLVFE